MIGFVEPVWYECINNSISVKFNIIENEDGISTFRFKLLKPTSNEDWVTAELREDGRCTNHIKFEGLELQNAYNVLCEYYDAVINEWVFIDEAIVPVINYDENRLNCCIVQEKYSALGGENIPRPSVQIVENITADNMIMPRSIETRAINVPTKPTGYDKPSTSYYRISERPYLHDQYVYYNNNYNGEAGCCVSNAMMAGKQVHEIRNNKSVLLYSVGWFFGLCGDGSTEGLMFEDSLSYLTSYGSPPFEVVVSNKDVNRYPDNYFQPDAKALYRSNSGLTNYSLPQKISSYSVVQPVRIMLDMVSNGNGGWVSVYVPTKMDTNDLTRIWNAIRSSNAVVLVSLNIYRQFDDASNSGSGWVSDITNKNDYRGGHMLLVVGWTTKNSVYYWICQNSWGQMSGDNGIMYIPFDWYYVYDNGNGANSDGIWAFFIMNDDPSAPALPNIPTIMQPPYITKRIDGGYELAWKVSPLATKYQLKYTKKSTGVSNSKEVVGTTTTLNNLEYGATYLLYIRGYKNGVWLEYSTANEGTVCPKTPEILSAWSDSDTQIAVSINASSLSGVYTAIEIRRHNINFTSFDNYIDKKVISSPSEYATWSGLTKGTKYTFSAKTYVTVNGVTLYSLSNSAVVECMVGKLRPNFFNWDSNKVKGQPFALGSGEWNRLITNIHEMCDYKKIPRPSLSTVSSNQILTAGMWNKIKNAIYVNLDSDINITSVSVGDDVKASYFEEVKSSINSIT